MVINATCSYCGQWIQSPEAFAGQEVQCPRCKQVVQMPASSLSPTSIAPQLPPMYSPSAAPSGHPTPLPHPFPTTAQGVGAAPAWRQGKAIRGRFGPVFTLDVIGIALWTGVALFLANTAPVVSQSVRYGYVSTNTSSAWNDDAMSLFLASCVLLATSFGCGRLVLAGKRFGFTLAIANLLFAIILQIARTNITGEFNRIGQFHLTFLHYIPQNIMLGCCFLAWDFFFLVTLFRVKHAYRNKTL